MTPPSTCSSTGLDSAGLCAVPDSKHLLFLPSSLDRPRPPKDRAVKHKSTTEQKRRRKGSPHRAMQRERGHVVRRAGGALQINYRSTSLGELIDLSQISFEHLWLTRYTLHNLPFSVLHKSTRHITLLA